MTTVVLNDRAAKLWRKGRPWFFADDVQSGPDLPALVSVTDTRGHDAGLGFWSPRSRLALRLCGSWPGGELPTAEAFFDARIRDAVARRAPLAGADAGVRLVHGEVDGLPGIVVDRYADVVVVQVGAAYAEQECGALVAALEHHAGAPRMILARNDFAVRGLEGLPQEVRLLAGRRVESVRIVEGGLGITVRPFTGHKTGFYLDQRPARAFVREHARGRRVLDLFSYQGGFALSALSGGAAHATAIDQSADALAQAQADAEANGLGSGLTTRSANAFTELRELRKQGAEFDLVIVDPPAFAKSRREVDGGLRGYRDLNRLALRVLAPGGVVVTCSCSHHVQLPRFEDILRQAAADLPFRVVLRHRLGAGSDHPVWLGLPESEYLKVVVLERFD
ncbi:MAG: class I SAM-dependent rRNA methyltransferase [Planctomycetota bacterium]|nr:class I SAM-dependent rRNA methyltransferase [Planctomycetota bacterium]